MSVNEKKSFIPFTQHKNTRERSSIGQLLDNEIDVNELQDKKPQGTFEEGKLHVDLQETETEFIILAPLAGIAADNIEIYFDNDIITVKAKIDPSTHNHGKTVYQECRWGNVSRSIVLPKNIKRQGHKAQLQNGLLTIILKKVKTVPAKKINIINYD